jgi:bifunctional aspartate aminotransferase and glutamate/aspartate-prephenate aminotransferase
MLCIWTFYLRIDGSPRTRERMQVISLSVGQPDFPTPGPVCDAAKAAIDAGKTKYTPNTGTTSLRQAICNKLRVENGLDYAPSEIVVTNGAKQAIWQAVLACVSPGDEVIVPAPYWVSYPEMVRMAGGTAIVIDTTSASNFCISPEQLRDAMTDKTRLLILCTPSNPSGAVYSASELMALADVVRGHPRMLVASDEIYEHIMYPPHKHVSFASLPEMWERTFTVNGVSKAFAMTGWRIGYVAAPGHFAKAAALIQSQSTSGACSVSQVRLIWLISNCTCRVSGAATDSIAVVHERASVVGGCYNVSFCN